MRGNSQSKYSALSSDWQSMVFPALRTPDSQIKERFCHIRSIADIQNERFTMLITYNTPPTKRKCYFV
jgi:hypothetical protein